MSARRTANKQGIGLLLLLVCGLALVWPVFRPWPAVSLEVPPAPRGRITDRTGTLSPAFIQEMDQVLARFERDHSAQIAVLMIPTLAGDVLEDYSIRLAEKWQIGRKGRDDGVIVLVVKQDRKIRIEVGYGLEDRIPDSRAGTIIRRIMAPAFRRNDFEGGIRGALEAIMAAIRGEGGAVVPAGGSAASDSAVSLKTLIPFFGLFMVVSGAVFGHALTYLRRRRIPLFLFIWSLGFGGIPFFMSLLDPKHPFFPVILGGFWLTAVAAGFRFMPFKGKGAGRPSSGGWRIISGGSSSGGGFSGGGGSFGGGGASGSW